MDKLQPPGALSFRWKCGRKLAKMEAVLPVDAFNFAAMAATFIRTCTRDDPGQPRARTVPPRTNGDRCG